MSYEKIKQIAIYVFCVVTMFPAFLSYQFKQPSYDITRIANPDTVTVVNANIRGFDQDDKGDRHWFVRGPLMIKTLEKAAPDILAMEEVTDVQYDYLKKGLKGYDSTIMYPDEGAFAGGVAIFYNTAKFNRIDQGSFWVSETPEVRSYGWDAACVRGCVFLILEQKSDGTQFAVFNTHLDHAGAEARNNGVKMIAERMSEYKDMPCILTGDFNFGGEQYRSYRTAMQYFKDAKYCTDDSDDGTTWHGWEITDYVEIDDYFLISESGVDVQQYKILRDNYKGVYPSDHYPIMMKISISPVQSDAEDEGVDEIPVIVPTKPEILF